jgi:hypothetical protein
LSAGYFSYFAAVMRYFFYLSAACLMLALAFTPSCKKRDDGFIPALVLQTEVMTSTGCGYLLRFTNAQLVKPANLPSAYWHDSMPVLIKYSKTGKQSNCMPQNPMDIISIEDIKHD